MRAFIFDDGSGQLAPLTDLRPSFDIRTGARTTLDRIEALLSDDVEIAGLIVPDRLASIVAELSDLPVNSVADSDGEVLLINGRCPLPPEGFTEIEADEIVLEKLGASDDEGGVVVARVSERQAARVLRGEFDGMADASVREIDEPLLLRRPWDVRIFRDAAIDQDLRELAAVSGEPLPPGVMHRGDHAVAVRASADIWPGVTIDSSRGPVVVAAGATVRPGAVLVGPCFIGEGSTVLDRSLIKGHTAIGPRCKIAGEVGGTIFQGFSNKAHEGHLGDSWVGEWVNFGAGTNNSNLLNTYGEVLARGTVGGASERTGQTFLGAIIGDHSKFAIGTRIMTGAVIHTGAMWAASGPVAGAVGPFTWATDSGSTAFRLTRFADTVRTVMGRRGMEPGEPYMQRLAEMHEQAAGA
ncbi:MAG: putative sugar nucleotidyl transferase [Planctomycetota bacterium]